MLKPLNNDIITSSYNNNLIRKKREKDKFDHRIVPIAWKSGPWYLIYVGRDTVRDKNIRTWLWTGERWIRR